LLAVRLSSSSVGVCNTSQYNVTHQGAARDGPVVLRPVMVRATPCFSSVERFLTLATDSSLCYRVCSVLYYINYKMDQALTWMALPAHT